MSNVVFELFAKLGLDSSDYEKGLDKSKSLASSVGGAIGNGLATVAKVGAAALGAATTATVAFATSSVKAGADFDKSMSQVAATMGLTMDEMQNQVGTVDLAWGTFSGNLREYAQEMGKNTAFSATEAADALNYMALAGYDAQTSMQMLPNVLNLAAAGNMDLARASDMVTDTQTAFGVSLERTSQMVDEMAKAASTGNTSVEQLGDAFLVVGGLAKEMNGGMVELSDGTTATYDNIQELEIALTAMANAGIKGSEAGTHMRNMLLKLSSPTEDGVKAFTQLGVSVFDSEGKMRSLSDIMGDLNNSMSNLTQEEKLQAISDIFNTRDVAAAEALMSAVGEDWDKIAESILDADGAAQQMAETQLDNLAGDVTLFQSALEGAKIAVSDGLTPSLRQFVQFGTTGLSQITDAFQKGGLSGAMEAFGTVLADGINMVITMLPQAINAGMQLLGAVGQGILNNLPVIIDAAVNIVGQLANGIVTALPSLVDGAMQIITGLADGIAQMAPTLIPTMAEVIANIVKALINNIPMLIKAGVNLIQGLLQGLLKAVPVLVNALPGIIQSLVDAIVTAIPLLIEGAIQLVMGIVEALPEIIQSIIDALPTILQSIIDGLLTALPLLIEGSIQLMMALVEALPEIILALVDAIPTIIQIILEALTNNLPAIINGLIQLNMAIVAALPQIVMALVEAIPTIIQSIVSAIVTTAPMFVEAVTSILTTIGATLVQYGSQFVSDVGASMSELLNTVVTWLSQLPTQMAYYAGYAIGTFIKFVAELPTKINQIFTDVMNKVVTFATNFKNKATEMAKTFFNNVVNGLAQLPSRVAALGQQLVAAIADLPSKFAEIGANIVQGIWNGISNGWSWLVDNVKNLASNLLQGAKDALGIQSPSKEFAYVGRMVDEGFAKGLEDYKHLIDGALDDIINLPSVDNLVGEFTSNEAGATGNNGYTQILNITSPVALTPYEVARQARNATRDMVLAMSM